MIILREVKPMIALPKRRMCYIFGTFPDGQLPDNHSNRLHQHVHEDDVRRPWHDVAGGARPRPPAQLPGPRRRARLPHQRASVLRIPVLSARHSYRRQRPTPREDPTHRRRVRVRRRVRRCAIVWTVLLPPVGKRPEHLRSRRKRVQYLGRRRYCIRRY